MHKLCTGANFHLLSYVSLFQGGQGGNGNRSNGAGGWSFYNPGAVLAILDPDGRQRYALRHLAAKGEAQGQTGCSLNLPADLCTYVLYVIIVDDRKPKKSIMNGILSGVLTIKLIFSSSGPRRPNVAKREGPGRVVVVAPARSDPCRANCSALGATCVALDATPGPSGARGCVCPDGAMLDYHNPTCDKGISDYLSF